MDGLELWIGRLPQVVLIALRIGALLAVAPVFGNKVIPPAVRVWTAVLLAVLLAPVARGPVPTGDILAFVIAAFREVVVGVLMGFAVMVVLSAAQFGGRLAGSQIGFGFASTIDPLFDAQEVILDRLQELLALTLFVTMGAHRWVLAALARSYEVVPLGQAQFPPGVANLFLLLFKNALVIGVQIGAPVVVSVVMAELAMALLSRSVPQFNLFSVGFGIRIVIGILVAALVMPATAMLLQRSIGAIPGAMTGIVAEMQPQAR